MPELPEVESFKRYVDNTSLHQTIETIRFAGKNLLLHTPEKKLRDALTGNTLEETFRHGKFLFIKLRRHGHLLLHFGMTGDLEYYTPDAKSPRVYVLLLAFTNGNNLVFTDSRRLGKIAIVNDVDAFIQERGYGVDALKITEAAFSKIFQKRKKAIKTALMDQKIVAGVGNEFSDEILFQARIHPMSIAAKLTEVQLRKIYHAMVTILKEAVGHNADRSKLEHYFFLGNRKEGLKCPGCKGTTEFKTVGGRSAYFCPACQKLYD